MDVEEHTAHETAANGHGMTDHGRHEMHAEHRMPARGNAAASVWLAET